MNGKGRQQDPLPSFPPPPREEDHPEHRKNMTTGLPNYAYRAMYDNQYPGGYPPPPPKHGSRSNDSDRSNRSRRSAHVASRGRTEEDSFDRAFDDGYFFGGSRDRGRERPSRRRPASTYDSERSYDSYGSRRHRDDRRRRGDGRDRSRRRSLEHDKRDQEVQKNQQQKNQQQQQQQGQQEEKKSTLAKFEEYITPFNVGILMGCMDLIGGSISIYMTNKRFSKKALAKGPAPGEPGNKSGNDSGGQDGGADKKQDNGGEDKARDEGKARHLKGDGRDRRSRSTASARNRAREGDLYRERDPYSRRDSADCDSNSSGTSYWSQSTTRRFRHMPERLVYDTRGRPMSADARALMRAKPRR